MPTPSPKCSQPQSLPLQSFSSSLQLHAVPCPSPAPAEPFPTLPSGMPFLSLVQNSSILLKPTRSPLSLPLPRTRAPGQQSLAVPPARLAATPQGHVCPSGKLGDSMAAVSFATYSSGMPESKKSDSKALTESLQKQKQARRHRI